jgi:hypothetical protein
MAISILYNNQPMRLFEADGDFAAGAQAFFYLARTTTPLTVYTDAPLVTAHTWPVLADAYGLLPPIYIAKGTEYKVRIEDAAGNILYAADGIDNPGEATGGGGGLVVTADQIAQTGDFIWTPSTAGRAGWVRANGQTISSAIGTGNTANDDCEALFAFLWNGFPDFICPVTPGGRGANAAADWGPASHKSIGTLDMRGRSAAGLDDMGNTAANLIQVATNISVTSGSATAFVTSSVGLCAGMHIIAPNVPAATYINSVLSPTQITLSQNATVTSSEQVGRFSIFFDAQTPGSLGGENVHHLFIEELPPHAHSLYAGATFAGGSTGAVSTAGTGAITGIVGLGASFNLQAPARLGSWWIKR